MGCSWPFLAPFFLLPLLCPETAADTSPPRPQVKGFDATVAQYFLASTDKKNAWRASEVQKKPVLVFVTRAACPHSTALKQAINTGTAIKKFLEGGRFLVVHAEDHEANEWQQPYQGYSPQVTFWAPGETDKPLPIHGDTGTSPPPPHSPP